MVNKSFCPHGTYILDLEAGNNKQADKELAKMLSNSSKSSEAGETVMR